MNTITDSKQVNLCSSSANVKNGTMNSVMIFNLGGLLKKETYILYNVISVIHAQIPISYYLVNNYNNVLNLSIGSYTLTNGNYNASTFITMLLAKLPVGFTLTINSTSGIFTLSYSSNFTIYGSSTCYKLLGLIKSTSYTSTSNTLVMPYPCNFLGINRLKIKSMVLKTNNIDTNSGGHSDLLTTIPVSNASDGLIVYTNQMNLKNLFDNTNVDYIDITITDENDNIIDFNNIDVYITLQIDTIRESLQLETNLMELLQQNQ
jgi:hypothetical protein